MGMFDEIKVPKSYLKGLLNKKDERLLERDHVFQTKDLDNVMDLYKVYRQRLYKLDRSVIHAKLADKWIVVNDSVDINFYDKVEDENGDEYSIEFEFVFKSGRLDQKRLISLRISATKKERNRIEKMWDTEQVVFNFYRENSIRYRIFSFLEKVLQKLTNWARRRHQLPLSLRKEAYEKSGRLKKDPKALDAYMDI